MDYYYPFNGAHSDNVSVSDSISLKKKKKKSKRAKKEGAPVKLSTDPQRVAARERRHRISERFKTLQRLVPGGAKLDTVSMLDEAIHYVKFLKTQIWLHETLISSPSVSADVYSSESVQQQPQLDELNYILSSEYLNGVSLHWDIIMAEVQFVYETTQF